MGRDESVIAPLVELDRLRRLVETEDVELVGHLLRRRELIAEIQALKASNGLESLDPSRELFLRVLWSAEAARLAGDPGGTFWIDLNAVFDQVLDFCSSVSAILVADRRERETS